MNCRNCNTRIDYNYLTNCPQCGCAVEPGDLPKLDPSAKSAKKNRVWLCRLTNLVYVLLASAAGMISGGVLMYVMAGAIYFAFASPETYPGQHCSRGMALGMLSIMSGAFLGTVIGAAFGIKHPILNGVRERLL